MGLILFRIDGAIGDHLLRPQLQGFHGNGKALQFFLDVDEILQLVSGDLTVHGVGGYCGSKLKPTI